MSKIADKNKELFGRYWMAVLPILLSALGYTGFDQYEKRSAAPAGNTFNIGNQAAPVAVFDHSAMTADIAKLKTAIRILQGHHP